MQSWELECHNGLDVHTLMSIVRLLFSFPISILTRCCKRDDVDVKDGAVRDRSGGIMEEQDRTRKRGAKRWTIGRTWEGKGGRGGKRGGDRFGAG